VRNHQPPRLESVIGEIQWAVRDIGSDRVLFATDTPLHVAGMQRLRIDQAELTGAEKQQVLDENAERVFGPRIGSGG